MRMDMEGKVLIQMQHSSNGTWDVNEVGASQPLASFGDIEKCVDYASNIAKERDGLIIQSLN